MFSAELINDPFADPGLYVKFKYRSEALLFDLGDLHHLPSRMILKISHIFVSHTHMDHFIGFDHILRICLGRDRHISLFGPPGFIKNVESKIASYSWNLVENYTNDFALHVTEIHKTHKIARSYHCSNAFRSEKTDDDDIFDGTVANRRNFVVKAAFLDHKIPSLAFSLEEKMHINILKNELMTMELPTGKWLSDLKSSIMRNEDDKTPVRVRGKDKDRRPLEKTFPLGFLKEKIVKITPGQKISYIADAIYNEENVIRITDLAHASDIMFIEASFLDEDADRAAEKYHLTAKQAGKLARQAGAKRIVVFHFSPKYKGRREMLENEAMKAFENFD
jgi:ribonuclease Z